MTTPVSPIIHEPRVPEEVDVVIIGGGPAGLQAALTLGRVHRRALLVDSGRYRNDAATHLRNFVTLDGVPPADFRTRARADLPAYETITVHDGEVTDIAGALGRWVVHTDEGYAVRAAAVVLATGLRDTLPAVPGLEQLWGDVVAHCPYCHGHEFAGKPVGLLGLGPATRHLAGVMGPVASEVLVFGDGTAPEEELAEDLRALGVTVHPQQVTGVESSSLGAEVALADGTVVEVGGLFIRTVLSQASPLVEQLGLDLLSSGCVEVDDFGRTSVPGIYAAGDLAHRASLPMPMASVLAAASAGQVTAAAVVMDLTAGTRPLPEAVERAG
ncbi:NAD(P)/FAD-dependent oxidoreductase [Ornithinimicrobium murale]|uniref:NAD(P)/FAD-dependent oxidoreductase n=1 Tax=Ornithinimicrobium murale TaxID=1050153 RepID=UPI000E0D68FA|nr:NAD(P)/FAD-dependent oxidoreductase [Ornithinimicrobium murale]